MRNKMLVALTLLFPLTAHAQDFAETTAAKQKEMLAKLSKMDGMWRGSAWHLGPDGARHEITQTERVGPLLDGTIKLIEGRGYDTNGKTQFNALAVLTWDNQKKNFVMRSYTKGRMGDFDFKLTDDGFRWEIIAGPATIRYTATLGENSWKEVGERVIQGQKPMKIFEMNLKRIGSTTWPAEKPVPLK